MEQNHKTQVVTVDSSPLSTEVKEVKHIENVYPPDRLEHYAEVTRNLISYENARLNERTTWLLQLQGLLFAALAFAWGKETFVIVLLGGVGIFSSLAIGYFLRLAVKAMDDIEVEWNSKSKEYNGPRIRGLSKNKAWSFERNILLYPPYMLPGIFIVAWVLVLGWVAFPWFLLLYKAMVQ